MKAIWKRIQTWLDANAPEGYGNLRPGASVRSIRAAEAAMGLTLPDDVKASFQIHDGQGNEPGLIGGEGWRLLSLQEMVEPWGRWSQANPKDARFVPVAWGVMSDLLFINLDPNCETPGCLMIQRNDSVEPDPLTTSFSVWLAAFADQLEDGELVYSDEHGEIMYADELDID